MFLFKELGNYENIFITLHKFLKTENKIKQNKDSNFQLKEKLKIFYQSKQGLMLLPYIFNQKKKRLISQIRIRSIEHN